MNTRTFGLFAFGLAGLSGCSAKDQEALMCISRAVPTVVAAPADPCDSFSSTLTLKDSSGAAATSFARGTPVTIELKITNNADTAKTMTIPDGCPQVRFEVDSSTPACLVYASSQANMPCTQVLVNSTYAAGETKTLTSQWSQTNSSGTQVPAGSFTAYGIDRSQCAAKFYSSATFNLR